MAYYNKVRPTYGALVLTLTTLALLTACGSDSVYCDYELIDGQSQRVCRDDDGDIQGSPVPTGDCVVEVVTQKADGSLVFHCQNGKKIEADPGQDGLPGSDGTNGSGCEVYNHGNGLCEIVCDTTSTTFGCGGTPGGGTGGSGGGTTTGPDTGSDLCEWGGPPPGGDLQGPAQNYMASGSGLTGCYDMYLNGSLYSTGPVVARNPGYHKGSIRLQGSGNCAVASQWGVVPFGVSGTQYVDVDSQGFALACVGDLTVTAIPFGAE